MKWPGSVTRACRRMTPEQVDASYDRIAERWLDLSTYGFAQIERAVAFVKRKGVALDVGCGPLLRPIVPARLRHGRHRLLSGDDRPHMGAALGLPGCFTPTFAGGNCPGRMT
jgi:hypothetical protein